MKLRSLSTCVPFCAFWMNVHCIVLSAVVRHVALSRSLKRKARPSLHHSPIPCCLLDFTPSLHPIHLYQQQWHAKQARTSRTLAAKKASKLRPPSPSHPAPTETARRKKLRGTKAKWLEDVLEHVDSDHDDLVGMIEEKQALYDILHQASDSRLGLTYLAAARTMMASSMLLMLS
jgi:hypothetical protein